jgi:hypothetical protein
LCFLKCSIQFHESGPFSRKTRARAGAREETWPADQVERWPVERLIPYARNARTHTPEQVAQIAASIREWGWTVPVLVNEQGKSRSRFSLRASAGYRLGSRSHRPRV